MSILEQNASFADYTKQESCENSKQISTLFGYFNKFLASFALYLKPIVLFTNTIPLDQISYLDTLQLDVLTPPQL